MLLPELGGPWLLPPRDFPQQLESHPMDHDSHSSGHTDCKARPHLSRRTSGSQRQALCQRLRNHDKSCPSVHKELNFLLVLRGSSEQSFDVKKSHPALRLLPTLALSMVKRPVKSPYGRGACDFVQQFVHAKLGKVSLPPTLLIKGLTPAAWLQ